MIYTITNLIGVVAFYNSIFNGNSTSLRDVQLQNYNSNCAFVENGVLKINRPGNYIAYLSVAHGQVDGNHGSTLSLKLNNKQVKTAYFDRVASNDTGTTVYEFTVSQEQIIEINCQVAASINYSAGASTASVVIVKND